MLVPQRPEEAQALQMIEMQMREAQMDPADAAIEELEAQRPDARARVQHKDRLGAERDLDA